MFQNYEDSESPRERHEKHRPHRGGVSGNPMKRKTPTVICREFIYCLFFLITDRVCVCEELFLNTPRCLSLCRLLLSLGAGGKHDEPAFYLNKDTSDGLFIPIS